MRAVRLRANIFQTFHQIYSLMPKTLLVWSQVLPRLSWRGEISHRALDNCRIRLRSKLATSLLRTNWAYIRYPELSQLDTGLFCDGVHFSHLGNGLFLNRLARGIEFFITSDIKVTPPIAEMVRGKHLLVNMFGEFFEVVIAIETKLYLKACH